MADRKIRGAVRIGAEVYTAGREDELEEVLTADSAKRLSAAGVISGSWKGAKAKDPEGRGEPTPNGGTDTLTDDVPGADLLIAAGITTRSEAAKLSEEQLTEIEGIGRATAAKIRAALEG